MGRVTTTYSSSTETEALSGGPWSLFEGSSGSVFFPKQCSAIASLFFVVNCGAHPFSYSHKQWCGKRGFIGKAVVAQKVQHENLFQDVQYPSAVRKVFNVPDDYLADYYLATDHCSILAAGEQLIIIGNDLVLGYGLCHLYPTNFYVELFNKWSRKARQH